MRTAWRGITRGLACAKVPAVFVALDGHAARACVWAHDDHAVVRRGALAPGLGRRSKCARRGRPHSERRCSCMVGTKCGTSPLQQAAPATRRSSSATLVTKFSWVQVRPERKYSTGEGVVSACQGQPGHRRQPVSDILTANRWMWMVQRTPAPASACPAPGKRSCPACNDAATRRHVRRRGKGCSRARA